MTNFLKKTAIATAMAAAMSAPAMAADFSFNGGFAATGTVVLASEIFGDEEGSGANETLVVMGKTQFDLSAVAGAGAALTEDGDNMNITTNATIKYTLGSGAVFAEDLSTTAAVNAANGGAGAFTCTFGLVGAVAADDIIADTECGASAVTASTWEVIQGGAIGDNTITFRITNDDVAEASIGGITFGNVAIKNLIPSLGDGGVSTFRGSLLMGVEYVEAAETTADTIVTTATDTPLQIFGSQPGVSLTSSKIDFDTATQNFLRINVGSGETTFTDNDATQGDTDNDGRTDFAAAGDLTTILLGTMTFARSTVDAATYPLSSGSTIVKKESGGDFDFQGGDTHNIAFSVGTGSLQVGGTLFLEDVAGGCDASGITDMTGESVTITNGSSVAMPVTGTTTELSTVHNLCYTVDGVEKIPELADSISASWVVDFFNTRYDNTDASTSSWGGLVRNGCIASFFNIPRSDNAVDRAFVRLTNTSTTNSGDIRGTMYAQDGSIIGTEDATVAPTLAIHATQIFTSQADDFTSGGYTVLSLNKALGATDAEYDDYGRGRLVLKGAFDTCEGMGLIRNLETGALYNMTSTTMGNEAGGANDGNNAQ